MKHTYVIDYGSREPDAPVVTSINGGTLSRVVFVDAVTAYEALNQVLEKINLNIVYGDAITSFPPELMLDIWAALDIAKQSTRPKP